VSSEQWQQLRESAEESGSLPQSALTTDVLQLFLREAGRYPLLTAAQEVELAKRIERGDLDAKRTMIDQPLGEQEGAVFGDLVADEGPLPEERVVDTLRKEALAEALGILGERERTVIILRYGLYRPEPKTLGRSDGGSGYRASECVSSRRKRLSVLRECARRSGPRADVAAGAEGKLAVACLVTAAAAFYAVRRGAEHRRVSLVDPSAQPLTPEVACSSPVALAPQRRHRKRTPEIAGTATTRSRRASARVRRGLVIDGGLNAGKA